jgi:hypothetical protein
MRIRNLLTTLFATLTLAGCNHIQLQRTTLQQASTVRDLQYQQVLDNLAMFHANPYAVPSLALLDTGTTVVQTSGGAGGAFGWKWDPFRTVSEAFSPPASSGLGQRQTSGAWVLAPTMDPGQLKAIRAAYQIATGQEDVANATGCPCRQILDEYMGDCCADSKAPDKSKSFCCGACTIPPPGWYGVGGKHDVPGSARYVGRYGKTFVWVLPGGQSHLTDLSLTILAIATPYKAINPGPAYGPYEEVPAAPTPSEKCTGEVTIRQPGIHGATTSDERPHRKRAPIIISSADDTSSTTDLTSVKYHASFDN